MPAKFRGFASDVFLLRVGPEQTELKVQRDILTQIPYFAKVLSSNALLESVELTFSLPDDDPSAVADVLWFVLVGSVPPMETIDDDGDICRAACRDKVRSYVKAYIATDRLMVDHVKSKILEMIVARHNDHLVEPDLVVMLREAGHHGSALYAFLVAQLALELAEIRHKYHDLGARAELVTSFESKIEEGGMSKADICRLLFAMTVMKDSKMPSESAFWLGGPEIEKYEDILKVSIQSINGER